MNWLIDEQQHISVVITKNAHEHTQAFDSRVEAWMIKEHSQNDYNQILFKNGMLAAGLPVL